MSSRAKSRNSSKSVLRTRAAVLAAGMGASLALGAGGAFAADAAQGGGVLSVAPASDVSKAVQAQADALQKAIDAEKAAAKKAAAEKAAKEAAAKKKAAELAAAKKKKAAELAAAKKKAAQEAAAKARQAALARQKAAEAAKKAAEAKANSWETPVASYQIGAAFGLAGNLWAHNHSGQDFVVPSGTQVRAVHGGVVVKAGGNGAGDGPAYGNAIVIKHDDNTYSQYAHLSLVKVSVGQTVTTGQEIGLSGNTGNTTGPHLHFEIRTTPNYGSAVEPLAFLRSHGVKV
ncbi:M23 family metallopeptidase [Streptomyces sp. ME19-01-6]|uniref:M23 family metallopeptidase n=1 Tax=Streptomyces sp. ME19-01-6 TaxID=3028686 RepID=UPI0029A19530|nr:M23 family metallopeptidase [Streptomyces sp. ME19-01-6]MDX3228219.1 M23 family metallopeptidase [Streptomyces sp. ME19-01-6]